MSSRTLLRLLSERGHDVLAAGFDSELERLDDPVLFAFAQRERRLLITHNSHDYPEILREWGEAGRSHHGCILSFLPTNDFSELASRLDRWFQQRSSNEDWIDLVVALEDSERAFDQSSK